MTTARKSIGSRRIPLHDHSDLNSGGKLRISQSIVGGLETITGSIPPVAGPGDGQTPASTVPIDLGSMGTAATINVAAGSWYRGTLTADCAISVVGFQADQGLVAIFEATQDGTGGWDIAWDADVEFVGDDQPDQTLSTVTAFLLFSSAGDSTIYGAKVGGATVAQLDDLTDVVITGGALGDILRHNGTTWVDYAGHYEPVVHDFGSGAEIVFDSGDIVMEWFD